MAQCSWCLVVCSAASRVFDETEPVDLLQRTLQLDGGSEGAAAQAERLRKVLPMAWIHVPKCGTSFANTLVGMPHFCPDAPENYDVESSAPDGCLFRVFAPNVCKSFCDQNYLHCWNGKDGNNYHAFVGNESQYLKVKGHMVGLFRQPEQRLLSAYYDARTLFGQDGHDWINGGNGTRCDKSHTGELSVPDFAPLFAGSMTYQLTYPQPVHWGAKYGPTITRSLALEAAKRVKEGFAYVGLTEDCFGVLVCVQTASPLRWIDVKERTRRVGLIWRRCAASTLTGEAAREAFSQRRPTLRTMWSNLRDEDGSSLDSDGSDV
eukprot:g31212.t1